MNRALRPIDFYDTKTTDENERYMQPPTYQQFDRLENDSVDESSTSFWVSLLYESINMNFQVIANFGGKKSNNKLSTSPTLIYVKLSFNSVEMFILKEYNNGFVPYMYG